MLLALGSIYKYRLTLIEVWVHGDHNTSIASWFISKPCQLCLEKQPLPLVTEKMEKGHETCLLMWHVQANQWTQSVISGKNDNCVQVSRYSDCIQNKCSLHKWELWRQWVNTGIFDVSNTSRLKESDPGTSFSKLMHDHVPQLVSFLVCYIPTSCISPLFGGQTLGTEF